MPSGYRTLPSRVAAGAAPTCAPLNVKGINAKLRALAPAPAPRRKAGKATSLSAAARRLEAAFKSYDEDC